MNLFSTNAKEEKNMIKDYMKCSWIDYPGYKFNLRSRGFSLMDRSRSSYTHENLQAYVHLPLYQLLPSVLSPTEYLESYLLPTGGL